MPKHQYSDDFKREAVKLVEPGRPKAEVARELGVANTTIGHWVEQFGSQAAGGQAGESDELKRLREENRQLKMERAILKKATAFFANPNK
jgi:transposase